MVKISKIRFRGKNIGLNWMVKILEKQNGKDIYIRFL